MISKGSDNTVVNNIRIIKESLSDYDIALRYLSLTSIPCLVSSPFRKDTHSSFSIYMTNMGTVLYKDFGTGESGTLFDLLAQIWGMTLPETYQHIADDITSHNLPKHELNKGLSKSNGNHITTSKLEVVTRDWKKHDLEYWNSYGISKRWLEFGDVYPISQIVITKNGITNVMPAEKYAYVYVERKDNKVSLKVYQPFSDKFKWMSKMPSDTWNLWAKLPESGDKLFITSSRKDALCLWANTGIPSVSMQGEGYMPKAKIIDELKHRFKQIILFYDNDFCNPDNPGLTFAKNLCCKFGLIMIYIPTEYNAKDPSDFVKKYSKQELSNLVKNLLWKEKLSLFPSTQVQE